MSPFFNDWKFKVREMPTWYFTHDRSNFTLAIPGFIGVADELSELALFFQVDNNARHVYKKRWCHRSGTIPFIIPSTIT